MAQPSTHCVTEDRHSLPDLLDGIDHVAIGGPLPKIAAVAHDSRRVEAGALFVCIRGGRFDGHSFIADAVRAGAVAVMGTDEHACRSAGVPGVLVSDPRLAMALVAHRLHGSPSRRLRMIGVTGTNGKSTVVHLLHRILGAGGSPAGRIGTLGAAIGDRVLPLGHTTPEAPEIAALLRTMADSGVSAVAMEVSSHGLAMKRTLGCEFDVGVFTNLTQDHLDFHSSLEDYYATKAMLFTDYPERSEKTFTAVINAGDPFGRRLAEVARGELVAYGAPDAAVRADDIRVGPSGTRFALVTPRGGVPVALRLLGEYNVSNALAAAAGALAMGMSLSDVVEALEAAEAPPGRLERVDCGRPFTVLVDYAHTPDALANALRATRETTSRRVIVVFGCGGDRDRGKRPKMGAASQALADVCYVTSDNPRSEDPAAIVREILAGMDTSVSDAVHDIVDRREAIFQAIAAARPGDTVLIAGKGHEDYQILGDKTIHFDDREVAREALARWCG
jgi:UDP-N-acetylmuramoyl-L-alanyl-D-glutamate--2,6-diaminopimelate ligase